MDLIANYQRYLRAKKSVDDRALNLRVQQRFVDELSRRGAGKPELIEMGAGIGTMIERLLQAGLSAGRYVAVDALPENILAAREWLCTQPGVQLLSGNADSTEVALQLGDGLLELHTADCFRFAAQDSRRYDALIANALLDLLPLDEALRAFAGLLKPAGLLYLTINFDGLTTFEPVADRQREEVLMALYHSTMDRRLADGQPSGDSRTGRRLLLSVQQFGGEILQAGSSDWIVHSQRGSYPGDEAFFLQYIIETIRTALRDLPEAQELDIAGWCDERLEQIRRGGLVFIAHQSDLLAGMPRGGPVSVR